MGGAGRALELVQLFDDLVPARTLQLWKRLRLQQLGEALAILDELR